MAAKRRALFLALATLLTSAAAVASIPRSTALDPPPRDRFELAQTQSGHNEVASIDNARLLHRALDRALPHQTSLPALSETRLRGSTVFAPLLQEGPSALSRAVRRASAFREFENVSDA